MKSTDQDEYMELAELRQIVVDALEELKGNDLVTLDVRPLTDIVDLMIIVSGTSNRHVRSLVQHIVDKVKDVGVEPLGVEGQQPGDWVLVDLTDIVVHVMLPSAREFYDLESLWGDFGTTSDETSDEVV